MKAFVALELNLVVLPYNDLPVERITPAPPFNSTAVDYARPIIIKTKSGRGAKTAKAYIGLFVCLATRAIHLELISDLTKDAFIAARGKPAKMISDNGTCFVDANRELQGLGKFLKQNSDEFYNDIEHCGISWSFIRYNY